ncbi:MAG: hypothetical protein GFH27_549287n221 [Chloroflexi bacterium AL-W]|nr:hypothetical protein [Chloroflexi bacterium AL-N1]NOK66495.1 hypothetical protein [Chloroflexi bacterium AL-N10]NOK71883.1 hypothetical protein [Chloroflexi bacterium AL-N5]NOK81140.1 hypothetical protein [Chloroflexi bacterium AL-W]NOK89413.1 hypothetical protein [Chloroflexi bacterium AL-N15]
MKQPFTIYVIQSAHTDIGFTHPQEQIERMYLDYYDRVLELCHQTTEISESHRFKWTCETSWQVRNYVEARPEREAELVHFVRTGQIEITASYLHFTDLIDPDAYRRSLEWVIGFCQKHDLPLKCALHCDINGWPWAVADILADCDIPYFCSHVHMDMGTDPLGRRGSVHYGWLFELSDQLRPDVPVRVPQAFWWQGPQGGRVLHWLNEHYHLGNILGLSGNLLFGLEKTRHFIETDRLTAADLYPIAQREIPRYIKRLQADGYPYPLLLLSTGGFYVDNSPPDTRWCEIIARWNTEHDDIHIRTATLSEWFAALETQNLAALPTQQVAWPDHWAHGLGAATKRIAQARRTQRRRPQAQAMVEQSASAVAADYLARSLENERLSMEHTFNAWCAQARPSAPMNDFIQSAKELYFHRAELYQQEAISSALRSITEASTTPTLYVYGDTTDVEMRLVHFESGDFALDPTTHVLTDAAGNTYPFQRERTDLPHLLALLPVGGGLCHFRLVPQPASSEVSNAAHTLLETNAWYAEIDVTTGGLSSLRDRLSNYEWVNSSHSYGFGQLVHEAIMHPLRYSAVGNKGRFMALDTASNALREAFADKPIFEHSVLQIVDGPLATPGPIFDTITLVGEAERIGRVQIHWRAYHALPLVELVLDWDKQWGELSEAVYVAFPFATETDRLWLESGGGCFQPGKHTTGGQLMGTCRSYYTVQRAASLAVADQTRLLWLPLDAPLVMPNAMNYSQWEVTEPWDWNGFLASMPVNHYWGTNFAISQRGHLRLRYRLCNPSGSANDEAALRMSVPLDALGWR